MLALGDKRQKAVFAQTAIYESRLHSAMNAFHDSFIDVSHRAGVPFFFKVEFRDLPVFRNGGNHISAIAVEVYRFFAHKNPPREFLFARNVR